MWKQGLDSGMVTWDTNVPYEDTTGDIDKMALRVQSGQDPNLGQIWQSGDYG